MSKLNENGVNYGLVGLVAVLAAVISSLVTYKATASNSMKFAVIDLPRVVAASKDIAALKNERETQLQDLRQMTEEANKKIKAESKDEARKKLSEQYLAEINGKKSGYDKVYASALQAADQKLNDTINSVAQKEGLKVVLNKSFVVTGGTDITESVVDLVK